ncbi:hypothetical protein [Acetomicrobium sp.]|nr:hypothetical protein [Acetomicrobium sp.]MDR9768820.1 hypothetical protein [Acetomicrobium sp.]
MIKRVAIFSVAAILLCLVANVGIAVEEQYVLKIGSVTLKPTHTI